jgi:hypothetical protein
VSYVATLGSDLGPYGATFTQSFAPPRPTRSSTAVARHSRSCSRRPRRARAPLCSRRRRPRPLRGAGRYDFVVKDDSTDAGLVVQKANKKPAVLTGVALEGKRTIRVNLTAGEWAFFAKTGRETRFVVPS